MNMFYVIIVVMALVVIVAIAVILDNKRVKALLAKAEQGDIQAQFGLYQRYRSANLIKAMRFLEKSAENGHTEAQVELGKKFMNGDGIEKNPSKAIDWFNKAAELGYAKAQYELGLCYMADNGVEKDYIKAFNWLQKAAEQEYAEAQYKLGLCYMMGDGVEEDDVKAFDWFKKAATNGSSSAKEFKCLADVQYKLALAYQAGEEKEKDPIRTMAWLTKAAEQGHAEAQYELGLCYLRGNGVGEDRNKAVDWCKKAVANGSKSAQAIAGFKEIEKAPEALRTNYKNLIKECCIELVKRGYYVYLEESDHSRISISVSSNRSSTVYIEFGTRGPSHDYSLSRTYYYTKRHLENIHRGNDELKHIIHLEEYDILIKSYVPWREAPPESLMVCAAMLVMQGLKISDPEWIKDECCQDAKKYVNVMFRKSSPYYNDLNAMIQTLGNGKN
jgi:TPR repeat protein